MLNSTDCRLASPHLVELYNALSGIMNSIRERIPRVAERPEFKGKKDREGALVGVLPTLGQMRTDLMKERFLVGLLGVTGASKSTTLNSLIGADLLPKGTEGRPCTSVVQRIRF